MGIILIGCQNETSEQPAEESSNDEQVTEENTEDAGKAEPEQETTEETDKQSEDNAEIPETPELEEDSEADTTTEKQEADKESESKETETSEQNNDENQSEEKADEAVAVPDNKTTIENTLTVVEDPDSVEVIVNKQRKLPDGYKPADLVEPNVSFYAAEGDPKRLMRQVAATALEQLFADAKQSGLEFVAVSGYRSYDRQKVIYENNVAKNGQEHADRYSARPGTSEHQTGLAMDVASAALVAVLEPGFIQTDEGQWLAENAHNYGFIIRYLEGKESITGYSYEPWHVRYVGKELATEVYEQQTTLEEFFGLYP
ncbi:D-alanyl-D-alanine carboxypeptidase family protein [Gracilibacillus oryzae]|uniref:D-alanyl-D-alanine carboxypeptidase family protein n=2 Tax=Gracilibacillus oryzae TaxID=1672701 RepID=A0A7C8GV68_9BACI|nr:D-alanyl-D-alanine carboxypeptidase family protein [Gracilibacillus oryzae]